MVATIPTKRGNLTSKDPSTLPTYFWSVPGTTGGNLSTDFMSAASWIHQANRSFDLTRLAAASRTLALLAQDGWLNWRDRSRQFLQHLDSPQWDWCNRDCCRSCLKFRRKWNIQNRIATSLDDHRTVVDQHGFGNVQNRMRYCFLFTGKAHTAADNEQNYNWLA